VTSWPREYGVLFPDGSLGPYAFTTSYGVVVLHGGGAIARKHQPAVYHSRRQPTSENDAELELTMF